MGLIPTVGEASLVGREAGGRNLKEEEGFQAPPLAGQAFQVHKNTRKEGMTSLCQIRKSQKPK